MTSNHNPEDSSNYDDTTNKDIKSTTLEPHKLVKTVFLHVRMLSNNNINLNSPLLEKHASAKSIGADKDVETDDDELSNTTSNDEPEEELFSEVKPFSLPLPIPPNSRLFQRYNELSKIKSPNTRAKSNSSTPTSPLSSGLGTPTSPSTTFSAIVNNQVAEDSLLQEKKHLQHVIHSMKKAIQLKKQKKIDENANTANTDGEKSDVTAGDEKDETEVTAGTNDSSNSYEKIEVEKIKVNTDRVNKRDVLHQFERTDTPYNSVNMMYNMKGYPYEDLIDPERNLDFVSKLLVRGGYEHFHMHNTQMWKNKKRSEHEEKEKKKEEERKNKGIEKVDDPPAKVHDFDLPIDKGDGIDRTQWAAKVMERNPTVRELRERTYPLERAISLGQIYDAGMKEVKDRLEDQHIHNIIAQHLVFEGLKNTKSKFEAEAHFSYPRIDLDQSLLHALTKEAVMKVEGLYDWVISDKIPLKERQKYKRFIEKNIDEKLIDLGLHVTEDNTASSGTTDINIWEDTEKDAHCMIHKDPVTMEKQLQAGSLNVLVERLTTPYQGSLDRQFTETFLTTYQSFCSPELLFTKLLQRFNVTGNMAESEYISKRSMVQPLVVQVFHLWVKDYYSHFDTKLRTRLRTFISEDIDTQTDSNLMNVGKSIVDTLNEKEKNVKDTTDRLQERLINGTNGVKPPEPRVGIKSSEKNKSIFSYNLSILECDEVEIARQMCLNEFELFSRINEQEFLNKAWIQPKLKHRCPNLLSFIDHNSQVTLWIMNIINSSKDAQEQRNAISKLIKTCEQLRKLNNFNSLKLILQGIKNSYDESKINTTELGASVHATYEQLSTLMKNNNDNQRNYRSEIRKILEENESGKAQKKPCIPLMDVLLTDLTFCEDGNPDFKKHNSHTLINWNKREIIYDIIKEVKDFQETPYEFLKVQQIYALISELRV